MNSTSDDINQGHVINLFCNSSFNTPPNDLIVRGQYWCICYFETTCK